MLGIQQQVRRVVQSGRWIEFLVREVKPELLDKPLRRRIGRMVSCEETLGPERIEGQGDDRAARLLSQPLPPGLGQQMNSHFENLILMPVRSQSRTARHAVVLKQEDGPVLNPAGNPRFDFSMKAMLYFILRKGAADQGRHDRVTPERHGQGQVVGAPVAESETSGHHKINTSRAPFVMAS
jgi:hypothetical protein